MYTGPPEILFCLQDCVDLKIKMETVLYSAVHL